MHIARSACPHDCPSTCALDVEVLDSKTIGRVRGAKDDPYTAGVICEKVARYAERIHNPNRVLYPLKRKGKKGAGEWQRITWEHALDEVAQRFTQIETEHGPEAIWPYYYAGTMGHVQRDSINRLRNLKGYSRQYSTICSLASSAGYAVGAGEVGGVDPVEMRHSDCVVIWGTNPVNTQVNVMTHAMKARKDRGAKLVVVDVYRNATMQKADVGLVLRPGSDGALACAVMHVLLRDGLADKQYMATHTDFDAGFEQHLATRSPEWAAEITGLSVTQIEEFAHLLGRNKATYFRFGFGFTRQRNGAANMHAALSIPAMTGAWAHKGGGALHSNSGRWDLDKSEIEGRETDTRQLDQSEFGPVLTGDADALRGGGAVHALLIQNTNPAVVVPEQKLAQQGLAREDLFTVVHEQIMTETAQMADIVLPATMFLEHDDMYTRGGHTRMLYGPSLIDAPGECRSNLYVITQLAARLGLGDQFDQDAKQLIEQTFAKSGETDFPSFEQTGYVERIISGPAAHFADGFKWPDGKYRFKPQWRAVGEAKEYLVNCDLDDLPLYADWWDVNEATSAQHPFKLATSPARAFLNTSFNETPGSQKREGAPKLLIHPGDAAKLQIEHGSHVEVGNQRGAIVLEASVSDTIQTGVLIAEGLHGNKAHKNGQGINMLTNSKPAMPFGGAAFHDCAVWIKPASV